MAKITLEQFVNKYDGRSVDFDKKYGAQCVDLFNYYNAEVVGAPWIGTPATNGARDLYEVDSPARRAYYDVLPPEKSLKAGDVLVYGEPHGRHIAGGKLAFLGHVNIYIGGKQVIEQNGKVSQVTVIRDVYKSGLLGILRPRTFIIPQDSQSVTNNTQNKNTYTILAGDTFWDLEERYNITHGTLQKLNPQLDPRHLKIGTEILLAAPRHDGSNPAAAEQSNQPAVTTTHYIIKQGDTFWELERAWSLPTGTLQRLNPGQDPRTLQIGQKIRRS